jgi:hypothetical protein
MEFFAVWRMFWGDLNTPDSFHDRPYEAGLNQIGHIALGAIAVCVACLAWSMFYAEMPYKAAVWLAVTGGYAVIIEAWRQGWAGADSVVDSAFFGMGAAIPLVALSEAAIRPEIKLVANEVEGLAAIATAFVALAVYVYPRARRKWGR